MRPNREQFKELYDHCHRLCRELDEYEIYLEMIDDEGAYPLIRNDDRFYIYRTLKQSLLDLENDIEKLKSLLEQK